MKLTKQQGTYLDSISKMDDEQLFDEYIKANQSDDSCFTEWGKVIKKVISEEMMKRLKC